MPRMAPINPLRRIKGIFKCLGKCGINLLAIKGMKDSVSVGHLLSL